MNKLKLLIMFFFESHWNEMVKFSRRVEKQISSCLFHLNVIKSIGLNAPEPIGITDHEVVTIDLYQINENEIIPENTNAVVNLAPTELQPTAANTAVNLAPTELQPVSVKIETISANLEEDTEL